MQALLPHASENIKFRKIKVYYGWVEVVDEFCPALLAEYVASGWFPAAARHAAGDTLHLIHAKAAYRGA